MKEEEEESLHGKLTCSAKAILKKLQSVILLIGLISFLSYLYHAAF